MKVTKDNIKDIKYICDYFNLDKGKNLLDSLLIDVDELNNLLIKQNRENKQIYIDYEGKHTEYSPERIDPCPDFYGCFTLRFESNPSEIIGGYMDLNQLDESLCLLINFEEF